MGSAREKSPTTLSSEIWTY